MSKLATDTMALGTHYNSTHLTQNTVLLTLHNVNSAGLHTHCTAHYTGVPFTEVLITQNHKTMVLASLHFSLSTFQDTLHPLHDTLFTFQDTLHPLHDTRFTFQDTLNTLRYRLYSSI